MVRKRKEAYKVRADCPSLLCGAGFQAAACGGGPESEPDRVTELRRQRMNLGDAEAARICGQNAEEERTAERERERSPDLQQAPFKSLA